MTKQFKVYIYEHDTYRYHIMKDDFIDEDSPVISEELYERYLQLQKDIENMNSLLKAIVKENNIKKGWS